MLDELMIREKCNIINFLNRDKRDYAEEIKFWDGHLAKKDEFRSILEKKLDKTTRKETFPHYLDEQINYLTKKFNRTPLLLEVGSGPLSTLAWGVDEGIINVTAIDPLADVYKKLMNEHGYDYPIKPINCSGENILKVFKRDYFDICYCQNALDHVETPAFVLHNMYHVLKKGGILCLSGHWMEGTRNCWNGLHKYDLYIRNNRLICKGKNSDEMDLLDKYGLSVRYLNVNGNNPGDWYEVIYEKL